MSMQSNNLTSTKLNDEYDPKKINNIIINEFFPYRHITLTSNELNDDEVISHMEKFGYIKITGITKKPRGIRNEIIMIIVKKEDQLNELKKIKKILEHVNISSETLNELFLIVNKELFSKKNFNDDIIKELNYKQSKTVDVNGKQPYYTVCPYQNFIFSVPKCKIIPAHIILTDEELQKVLKEEHTTLNNLPIILLEDVPIVWNGGRPGQVVKILRPSESSLYSIYYRKIK